MTYELADAAIKDLNKRNLRLFDSLRTVMKFDELNVMKTVSSVYDESLKLAKKRFKQIALEAYIEAMVLAGIERKKAEKQAEDSITEDWILDMLEDYNALTLYRFDHEVDRKKQRTAEAIIAANDKVAEIDKALRLWSLQLSQYSDFSVLYATIDGYRDAGVKYVKWIAEKDEKTCSVCYKRDGKTYRIDKVPPPPHYHCRCELIPAKNPKED